ncbi:MAG: L,D-transpeptidase [Hyphomicrobiaceae bacterium]|nr:L,D-transpeptidase [Hyphomicrobiaceae bacterium]
MKRAFLAALAAVLLLPVGAGAASAQQAAVTLSRDLSEPWVLQLRPAMAPGRRVFVAPSGRAVPATRATQGRRSEPQRSATRREQAPAPAPRAARGRQLDPTYLPQVVQYNRDYAPGTIVIDTPNRFLFLVQGGGRALRYGVGVGRPGFSWAGVKQISAKKEWPDWVPPKEMLQRRPDLPRHMEGGPNNPLGARAMYLGSSLYRIHGSNEPWTIGHAVSSGCIRMRNEDVQDLYERVRVGANVVVL